MREPIGSSMLTGWEADDRIRGSPIATLELSGATARLSHQTFTHTFTELAQAVRIRGLQGRRRGFYLMIFAVFGVGTSWQRHWNDLAR